MKKVILTGSTGMVGKAVLIECLDCPEISQILIINRRPLKITHPKIKEIIHANFYDLSSIKEKLYGYDACFFCSGVSSIGLSEKEYHHATYDLTLSFAETLYKINREMVFTYVSGTGTDSSEKGKIMWARVKGKTENDLLKMGFKDAYMFRPGIILPEKGIRSATGWYNTTYIILRPFFPLLKKLSSVTTTTKLGQSMINVLLKGYPKKHLENQDINLLAK